MLKNRYLKIEIDLFQDLSPELSCILSSVHQVGHTTGFSSGSLLLIFINVLSEYIKVAYLTMYADDTKFTQNFYGINYLESNIDETLDKFT